MYPKNKILVINLQKHSWDSFSIPEEIFKKLLGGRGLAAYLFSLGIGDSNANDSSSWHGPLVFAPGALCETPAPLCPGLTIAGKSPLTDKFYCSWTGSELGAQIKKNGYQGIVVTEKADLPTGVIIESEQVYFKDASSLSALPITDLRSRLSGLGPGVINGTSGENLSRLAGISASSWESPLRGGLGAVMGALKLKFLAVKPVNKQAVKKTFFASPECRSFFNAARRDIYRRVFASPALTGTFGLSNFGQGAIFDLLLAREMLPADNFQRTMSRVEAAPFLAPVLNKTLGVKAAGCRLCPIRCRRVDAGGTPLPAAFEMALVLAALGPQATAKDLMDFQKICSDYGMDPVGAAGTINAWKEINGLPAGESDSKEILELTEKVALAKDAGRILTQGSRQYALQAGRPEVAMQINGLEIPGLDPRGAAGLALGMSTCLHGPDPLRNTAIFHEILRKPVATDRHSFSGKIRLAEMGEEVQAVAESLGVCAWALAAVPLTEFSRLFTALYGEKPDLAGCAKETLALEKRFRQTQGKTKKDLCLPSVFSRSRVGPKRFPENKLLKAMEHFRGTTNCDLG